MVTYTCCINFRISYNELSIPFNVLQLYNICTYKGSNRISTI